MFTVLAACGLIKIPLQAARDIEHETYSQSYWIRHEKAFDAVKGIFGENNLCAIRDDANWRQWYDHYKDLLAGRLVVDGSLTVSLSVSPWQEPEQGFFLQGVGRYSVRGPDDELIATADYEIVGDRVYPFSTIVSESDSEPERYLDIVVVQHVVREFISSRPRFAHPSVLVARVWLKRIDKEILSIDYGRRHVLGIVLEPTQQGQPERLQDRSALSVEPVGCIDFKAPDDNRKLVDLRWRDKVRHDYEDQLRAGGNGEGLKPRTWDPKIDWTFVPNCDRLPEMPKDTSFPTAEKLKESLGECREFDSFEANHNQAIERGTGPAAAGSAGVRSPAAKPSPPIPSTKPSARAH